MPKPEEKIYVRVPFAGFIAPINQTGPLKCFLAKKDIIALIQSRYEVVILNPASCPEFAEQLVQYHEFIKVKNFQKAQELAAEMRNINHPMAQASREAAAQFANTANLGTGSTLAEQALLEAKKREEELGLIPSTDPNAPPPIAPNADQYQNELNRLGTGPDGETLPNPPSPFDQPPFPEGTIPPDGTGDLDVPDVLLPNTVEKYAEETDPPREPQLPGTDSDDITPKRTTHGK
jgi:hypothetical protein